MGHLSSTGGGGVVVVGGVVIGEAEVVEGVEKRLDVLPCVGERELCGEAVQQLGFLSTA